MSDSQKFISRNRAPRVQIEYDVELYGATKKIQLPFVMGVMSDLSGKSEVDKGGVADRSFLEIDIDNFDSRMKALKPRAAFSVPNTLSGEGNLSVDLVFEKMADFSPAAIAAKVEPLRKLLEARTQLANLMTYMDGKAGAEELLEKLMADPTTFRALALGGAAESGDADAAFAAIKAAAPDDAGEPADRRDDILAGMAGEAVEEVEDTSTQDTLAAMRDVKVEETGGDDTGVDDLLAMVAQDAPEGLPDGVGSDPLAGITFDEVEEPEEDRGVDDSAAADILADISAQAEDAIEEPAADPLAALSFDTVEETEGEDDGLEGLLAEVAESAVEDAVEEDDLDNLLAGVAESADDETPEDDGLDDLLSAVLDSVEDQEEPDDDIDSLLADVAEEDMDIEEAESDPLADIDFGDVEDGAVEDDSDLDGLLADIADDADDSDDGDDDPLAGIEFDVVEDADEEDDSNLDALLAGLSDDDEDADDPLAGIDFDVAEDEDDDDDLDALLSAVSGETEEDEETGDDIDSLLADVADVDEDDEEEDAGLDDLLAGFDSEEDDDLDGLLADMVDDTGEGGDESDLDDLLPETSDEAESVSNDDDDMAVLLGDMDDDGSNAGAADEPKESKPDFSPDFGTMSAPKLNDQAGSRRKFRIALLGDFSGRGNRGDLETGAALGKRKGFKLDFDTMEQLVQRFRTTLTLPLGDDGSAVKVELNELDDLHPDELFENVEMFNELNMLRRDLVSGRNLDAAIAKMEGWGDEFGSFRLKNTKRAKGSAAPADMRLSDFQSLIGETAQTPEASATQDLISRIIGPHIKAAKDHGTEEMIAVVDRALSAAMGTVLHHPDFQTVEAAWRSIELLGRRVEASADLEVVVYDLSVEEFTADLAGVEDMSETGLFDMLVEKPRLDDSGGPISAVIGLYTWEETPTHAELLARMSRICAHMDAPFVSAMSTAYLSVKPEDRHPLVIKTWGALRGMPEAKYLGLATPRFLMRMPYGKKTDPIDRFGYEEFNTSEGMRSLLLGNPAVLVAVLLAKTKARQGKEMDLGTILSLDDMPFHFMTDQYGDQVALPCTERLLNVRTSTDTVARGFMPVLSVQGQNIVKLGSFQSVGRGELLGIWSGDAAKDMGGGSPQTGVSIGLSTSGEAGEENGGKPKAARAIPAAADDENDDFSFDMDDDDDDDDGLDDLLGGLDMDDDDDGDDGLDDLLGGLDMDDDDDGLDDLLGGLDMDDDDDDGDDDLDALLAGFGDDDDDEDDDDMDLDLEALLGDL